MRGEIADGSSQLVITLVCTIGRHVVVDAARPALRRALAMNEQGRIAAEAVDEMMPNGLVDSHIGEGADVA